MSVASHVRNKAATLGAAAYRRVASTAPLALHTGMAVIPHAVQVKGRAGAQADGQLREVRGRE
eukprot:190996-Chlamydomonas_euryale.AAC.1